MAFEKLYQPGEEIVFFETIYTLIEPAGKFGWMAIEQDNPRAKP